MRRTRTVGGVLGAERERKKKRGLGITAVGKYKVMPMGGGGDGGRVIEYRVSHYASLGQRTG